MLFLRCRWFYVSFAPVALCTARLYVVLALPLVCRWVYVSLARSALRPVAVPRATYAVRPARRLWGPTLPPIYLGLPSASFHMFPRV